MKKLFLTLILFFCLIGVAFANPNANVTFQWDANLLGEDLAGYRLYRTDVPGQYVYGMNLPGLETNHIGGTAVGTETITILEHDGTWYYVVTAFDSAGNESGPSNEVSTSIDTTPPSAPGGLRIMIIVNINQ